MHDHNDTPSERPETPQSDPAAKQDSPTPPPSATPEKTLPTASEKAKPSIEQSLDDEIAAALGDMSLDQIMDEEEKSSNTVQITSDGRRTRNGMIVAIQDKDVMIEFGPKSQGICPIQQFESTNDSPPEVGSKHDFVVERFDPFDGLLIVSLPGAIQKADWGTLEVGQIIEARCVGVNRGGLEMEVDHHKGFMPAGQVEIRHVDDISTFIGEKFSCKIIELKKAKNRLVLSRKAVLMIERESQKKVTLEELAEGQLKTVTITSIQPYGAFADLGGVDGLIHISDISHERIKNPGDVLKVGETLQVEVLKVDTSGDQVKIGLGRKQVMSDPTAAVLQELAEGAEVTGRVKKIMDFGAFIELAPGVEGLVHISQVSHERVESVAQALKKDEIIQVKILSIDPGRNRISLSIKAMTEAPARTPDGKNDRSGGKRGRGRGDAIDMTPREDDPAMRKLKARFSSNDLKGGLS
jgi:ribosomal protein S1